MAQEHLDGLSAVDAAFLHQEGPNTHMHIGGIALLEGPAPPYRDLVRHIRSRLHLVPRYRQKLAAPPLGLGRWRWVDDPNFNLDYHVRHTGLPGPGGMEQLLTLTSRVYSQRLDRTKPLWEVWLVDRLEDGRWALVSKTHHALVDGISGVDLMTMLFDLGEEPRETGGEAWHPRPEPSVAQLTATSLNDAARRVAQLPLKALGEVLRPTEAAERARETAQGVGEVAWAALNPPPDTPLNVRVGPHRRYAVTPASLEDFKAVKNAFGGTVNDVVLAVVAGALRAWLHSRGMRTEGLELRACVPVSVRTDDERGAFGNKLVQILCPLPVHVTDPIDRLKWVSAQMQGLKESKQALGAEVIAGAQDFAPPTILAQASRMNFSQRFYNLLVTNVPGPQIPVYALGRRLEAVFPVPFLAGDRALAVAIMSYDGGMNFGLIADLDALPDLDAITDGLQASLAELVSLAHGGPLSRRRPHATPTQAKARAKRRAER
ncbi:MAG TPA: wax ester/triacylglycerol synthase family O-acyltransferase, partial [Solirubrobacteraceae bacterium]|nr:wax ester/triacylglycerol synthase family O-acyltransferase [Solirubrobacteraceae bacterium]